MAITMSNRVCPVLLHIRSRHYPSCHFCPALIARRPPPLPHNPLYSYLYGKLNSLISLLLSWHSCPQTVVILLNIDSLFACGPLVITLREVTSSDPPLPHPPSSYHVHSLMVPLRVIGRHRPLHRLSSFVVSYGTAFTMVYPMLCF